VPEIEGNCGVDSGRFKKIGGKWSFTLLVSPRDCVHHAPRTGVP